MADERRLMWGAHVVALGAVATAALLSLPAAGAPTETKLLPVAASQQFGLTAALDGDTAVVGAGLDDEAASDAGAVFVFTRSGGSWTQQQKLLPSPAADFAGFGVSIAVDGDTLAAGAPLDLGGTGSFVGAAYVFVRSGTAWTEQQKLLADDKQPNDNLGTSIDVDGDTLIAGAPGDDGVNPGEGSAYVFVRSGAAWTFQQKLVANDPAQNDEFGHAVAVSGDTAIVTSRNDDDVAENSGSAYVFVRSGTTWTQQQKLTAAVPGENDFFGRAAALDGDTAVVGAPNADAPLANSGAAYVFVRSGTTWTEQQKLVAGDPALSAQFGGSVTVIGDTVVAGAPVGRAAYVFARTGATWSQAVKLTPSVASNDVFGASVSVSGDRALVGAPGPAGAAYVYDGLAGSPAVVESFFLPKTVKAAFNARDTSKSKVTAVGILDLGPNAPNLTSAATVDVGGVRVAVPGLTASKKAFTFSGQGLQLSVTPNPFGSSRAKFKLTYTGDLTGKVARDGPLALEFANAAADGGCTVRLANGVFGLGKVRGALVAPNLFLVRARATLKGAGNDALTVVVGLATAGTTPPAPLPLSIGFGDTFAVDIPSLSFVRKGDTDQFSGNFNGITKVVVDHVRETVTITGKGLSLGNYAEGGNSVRIRIGLGADTRSVRVRMGRSGTTMKY